MNIETEFELMVKRHENRSKTKTSIQDVLQVMVDNPQKVWWWAWEFGGRVTSKGGYLSHRACARASDLAIHYPELVEDRKIGRFKVYRLKVENMASIDMFLHAK